MLWGNKDVYRDEAGDGSGGGSGGGSGDGAGGGGGAGPDVNALLTPIKEQIEGLALNMRALSETVQSVAGSHQQITGTLEELRTSRQNPPQDDVNIDLETMDRKQFADFITGKVLQSVQGLVGKVEEKIGGLHDGLNRSNIQGEVTRLTGQYKDFLDFRGEVAQEVKQNPSLSLEDAYLLARSRNTKKAADLDAKYNPKPQGKSAPRNGFYGFGPSSGSGGKSEKMNFSQAAELAWNDVEAALDQAFKGSSGTTSH